VVNDLEWHKKNWKELKEIVDGKKHTIASLTAEVKKAEDLLAFYKYQIIIAGSTKMPEFDRDIFNPYEVIGGNNAEK